MLHASTKKVKNETMHKKRNFRTAPNK